MTGDQGVKKSAQKHIIALVIMTSDAYENTVFHKILNHKPEVHDNKNNDH